MIKIQEVSIIDVAFGGNIKKLLPKWEEIPEEFKNMNNSTKWNKVVSDWFFCGLKNAEWIPKDGIDSSKALAHVRAILVSFEPKHEHKEAGCAYLLNEWFEGVTYELKNRTIGRIEDELGY